MSMLKNLSIELEVLNGVPLFVDHVKQDAFLKDPKHQVSYNRAVQAITNLGMKCEKIVTDTMFRYEVPPSNRLTFWQKERLVKMANMGCPAHEIANSFRVSEEAIIKVVGEIIERKKRKALITEYLYLSDYYKKLAQDLTNA